MFQNGHTSKIFPIYLEQTDLTWTDTEKIGHYLKRLREYTEKLARQNNQLASYHKQVSYTSSFKHKNIKNLKSINLSVSISNFLEV